MGICPQHSPWGPVLPEVLIFQTGPGGNKDKQTLAKARVPQQPLQHPVPPSTPPCPPAYPSSFLSTGSRKTRKAQGSLVRMEKEEDERRRLGKGQRG